MITMLLRWLRCLRDVTPLMLIATVEGRQAAGEMPLR